MQKIDLHTHSSYSDGIDSPEELINKAFATKLKVVALSDHDTFAGLESARQAVIRGNHSRPIEEHLEFVPAVEISSSWEGITLHILGYYCDEKSTELLELFSTQRQLRAERIYLMYERIAKDYPLKWEDVLKQAYSEKIISEQYGGEISGVDLESGRKAIKPIGRPHLADALIAKGYFSNRAEAFRQILHPASPYYISYQTVDPFAVIEKIRFAGGVPVLAHPRAVKRQQRFLGFETILDMRAKGLFALEVTHPEQQPEDQEKLRQWCGRLEIPYTGGSDYHGSGKPNRLGQGYTRPEVFQLLKQEAGVK